MVLIIVILVLFFIIPFVCGLFGVPLFNIPEQDETSERKTLEDINKQERVEILDNTLVQYHKLLDSLSEQLREETNEKKRAAILKQQIITLEKLNKALEKREKLE
jgi:type VI protein secretion system component VasF